MGGFSSLKQSPAGFTGALPPPALCVLLCQPGNPAPHPQVMWIQSPTVSQVIFLAFEHLLYAKAGVTTKAGARPAGGSSHTKRWTNTQQGCVVTKAEALLQDTEGGSPTLPWEPGLDKGGDDSNVAKGDKEFLGKQEGQGRVVPGTGTQVQTGGHRNVTRGRPEGPCAGRAAGRGWGQQSKTGCSW